MSELRRRNVLRMAVLYVLVAWVIMQVAEVVIDLAVLPDWMGRVVLALLAIGFPIALIFSWFYELTPAGISLEKHVDPADSITHVTGRRMDFIIIAVLSAAVILFAAHTWWPRTTTDMSIAVLPFDNLSEDQNQEYFSDGVSEELLNKLAQIPELRVISRSSAFAFKGKNIGIPDLARRLNVAHVLEGSVRRSGNSVRIAAQLVDASSDTHLWSETYDRELTTHNIFEIQSEIATAIAGNLRATLTRQDEVKLRTAPTTSLEAYQSYLLGRQRLISRASASLDQAARYFREAIEIDPGYALAYVGLADTYMLLGDYAGLSLREMLSHTEPAIARALELDDQLAPAYAAKGAVRAKAGDFAVALAAFERAIELDPGFSRAYHWYGDVLLSHLRQPENALPLLERAYALDPISPALIVTVGQALSGLGRFNEAMATYEKVLEIEPAYASTYNLIGSLHARVYGRLDLGVRWSLDAASRDPGYVTNLSALGSYYLALGDPVQAEYWIDRALSIGPDRHAPNAARTFLHFYRGQASDALSAARALHEITPGNNVTLYVLVAYGRYEEALSIAAVHYPQFSCDREPEITRASLFPAINVSLALEETGRRQCADRLLDRALEQMQTMPRSGSYGYGFADVEVYARQGRSEQALAAFREAIDQGLRTGWWTQVDLSPHTTGLHDEAEFQAMLDEIRLDMSEQLARLQDMVQ